jgi:Flp pilus assembly protein TadD
MPWSPAPLLALGTARLEQGDSAGARASFREAISLDPRNWVSWLDLAATLRGHARSSAVDRARALYPRSPEIVEFEKAARAASGDH